MIHRRKIFDKKAIIFVVPTFFIIFSIYLIGFLNFNNGITTLNFYKLIVASLKSFAFDTKTELISKSLENTLYYFVYCLGIGIAALSTAFSIIGLCNVVIINGILVFVTLKKNPDIVIGNTSDSIEYCKKNKNSILFINSQVQKLSSDEKGKIFGLKIPFIYRSFKSSYFNKKIFLSKKINFIYMDKIENIHYLYDFLKTVKTSEKRVMIFHVLTEEESIYYISDHLTEICQKNEFLTAYVLNRYELLGRNFCIKQNLAYYLPKTFLDGVTIKKDKKISVNIVGCGKTGKAILKAVIMNNQFVTLEDNEYKCFKVTYNVFDKIEDNAKNALINFINSYNDLITSKDTPAPEQPCFVNWKKINIKNDFDKIHFSTSDDEFVFTILCLNKSMDNCQIASLLSKNIDLTKNVVFYNVDYQNEGFVDNGNIVPFGFKHEMMSHDAIVNNTLGLLADLSNQTYWDLKDKKAPTNFHKLSLITKLSNFYADLNIKFKLNLLGLDMVKDENCKSLTKDEFYKYYNHSTIDSYDDYFKKSIPNALAYQEHLRWCTFYLLQGFTTLSTTEFKFVEYFDSNGKKKYNVVTKDEFSKKHGCLTTYAGLDIVHKKIYSLYKENDINKELFKDCETYQYDFALMDNVYDLLRAAGYKIIIKTNK